LACAVRFNVAVAVHNLSRRIAHGSKQTFIVNSGLKQDRHDLDAALFARRRFHRAIPTFSVAVAAVGAAE
jgi:hypothetical protein